MLAYVTVRWEEEVKNIKRENFLVEKNSIFYLMSYQSKLEI